MIFSKKINRRVVIITITLMTILIIINIGLMSYSAKKASEFTFSSHYMQVIREIEGYSEILKTTADTVVENEKIIEILKENRSISDFDEEDIILIKKQIYSFEKILKNSSFIKTINIVSIQGKYILSNGTLYENFNIEERPWFKEEYLNGYTDAIITKVHKDFSTGENTISVIKFIYSEGQQELLGAVILDIFAQDLLRKIDEGFYLGALNSYISTGDDGYLSKNRYVNEKNVFNDESLIYFHKIFDDNVDIVFQFDRKSNVYTKQMSSVNTTISIILIVTAIILSVILIRLLKLTFNPVITALNKLKVLLNKIEKSSFEIREEDEFQQLEVVSDYLDKTFDKRIESLIYYDELTKLPNRKMLISIISKNIENKNPFALIFIDLNKVKYVNDIFGHNAGDNLLINISKELDEVFNNKGIVTRYSGDKFAVIYNDYKSDEELLDFYNESVLNKFLKPIQFDNNNNILVEFSSSVSVYPRDGENLDELIKKSDFMIYSNGKNKVRELLFFNNDIYEKIRLIEDVKMELKKAVERNELILHYQPIVDNNMKIEKVEALIRWKSNKFGFVSPLDFIGYAEESGVISEIGYWIIEEVCRNYNDINKDIIISINVSPIQLLDIDFVENVKKIVYKYNIDFESLCFEITESVLLDDNIIVYDNVYLLRELGIKIALDDFGTGYTSFSYLKKYKLDILKIDKIFITNIEDSYFSIVENINNIAHVLDMEVVIEGVETKEQFENLKAIGCDYFQGYYFSKPIELNELKKIFNNI